MGPRPAALWERSSAAAVAGKGGGTARTFPHLCSIALRPPRLQAACRGGGRAVRRQGWAEAGLCGGRARWARRMRGVSARRAGPGGKAVRGWRGGAGPIPTRRGTFELPPAPERRALADTASFRPGLRRSINGGRGGRSCYHTAPKLHVGTQLLFKEAPISHAGLTERTRTQNLSFIKAVSTPTEISK